MNILGCAAGFSAFRPGKQILASLLWSLLVATMPQSLPAQDAPAPDAPAQSQAPPYAQQTPEQLQRLVAPIALYPDSLVAQILAGSTFPEQVVEADRWVQAHPDLKGEALGQSVDQQPWDPSVKALAGFPSVLGNMDKNLSWTSSLGDAYYNQQQDVMDAVQVMRKKAQDAGALKNPQHEVIKEEGPDIEIEPAEPDVVYVPAYDPWLIYGYPIVAWPGWYPYPGIWFDGPYFSYGLGFGIGWWGGFGWGWGHWGFDWHHHYARFGGGRYYSRSRTFYNRNGYYRGGGERGVERNVERGVRDNRGGGERGGERAGGGRPGGFNDRGAPSARPFGGDRNAARGYGESRGESGVRSGAFSGYDHGGETRSYSSRGSSSMAGGGRVGGGGGGSHGGGGHH